MKIIDAEKMMGESIQCPKGGFSSLRMLTEDNGMGYTICRTVIPPNNPQRWHYKNHLESCYCVSGSGILVDIALMRVYEILPAMLYVLDKHDEHIFMAKEEVILISVFNPPLRGDEVHQPDGSYRSLK